MVKRIQLENSSLKLYELPGYIQSIYLVVHEKRMMLLDGCCRADIPLIKTFIIEDLKRSFDDLSIVIVTHMHPDHAGAAHKLRQLTHCKIAVSNIKGHWYSGLDGFFMHLTDIALAIYVARRKGKTVKNLWYSAKLKSDILLDNNALIPGFEEWQVIKTPGHTDRDISLHHLPSNKVYVADLIVTVRGKYIPPFPLFYPRRYIDSLMKIKSLNSPSIILAHSGEVHLTKQDFDNLFSKTPNVPVTHWRSIKVKLKQLFSFRSPNKQK